MKKFAVLALCLMVTVSGVFAMDKAFGGGLLFNAGSTIFSQSYSEYDYYYGNIYVSNDYELSRNGFGAFAFFGISQFWELNLGLLVKTPDTMKVSYTYEDDYEQISGSDSAKVSDYLDSVAALQLGLYFKYPIPINDSFVFFPTGGIDLELTLGGDSDWDWWSDFWFRVGVGVDYFINEKMFLRGHLIYGLAVPFGGFIDEYADSAIGHGLLIKFGIGLMLQ